MYVPNTGKETSKIRSRIVPYLHGHGIDIGCGDDPIVPKDAKSETFWCLGVDQSAAADITLDAAKLDLFADESLDFVYSSHCLEDFAYWQAVLKEWWRVVKVGGTLTIYCPIERGIAKNLGLANWEDFYPDMDSDDEDRNPNHRSALNPVEVKELLATLSPVEFLLDEIRNTKDDNEYSFLIVAKKLASSGTPGFVKHKSNGKPAKKAIVIRYGAFGDCIQASPVISVLAKQGYTVDVNTTPYAGVDVFKHNPHVNRVLVQERNAIPLDQLADYFKEYEKSYDKVVNLCGAVEDSLLVPDGRAFNIMNNIRQQCADTITDKEIFLRVINVFRKQFGDKNYFDAHLEKAGLTERGLNGELYFSDIEHRMAHDFLRQHQGKFVVLWSLSGSAFHKIYPYFYQTVQGILSKIPNVLVVSVGDAVCRILEPPPSARYLPRSGDWSIRMSMIMTRYADLVIGPETGILNAAGCFDTPKITLRSHSTHDNLCKYWANDFCLEPDPERVPCYPCHILHYTDQSCMTAPVIDPAVGKIVDPDAKDDEFSHPLCMSWGVRPEQIIQKVIEVRERFPLKNPRAQYAKSETVTLPAVV